ncbi:unnamed protein product [Bursaphelenchus okinawaensis]|uniref:Major facilitator superfamily (MFS) profile domain-containing protein n=1 Tax=Bursaphelenchus okinawaensis TaxID=465554 RepID=A0A811LJM6_9BILA|nr:unnamed protein product [Bursaphelenchus okinawaensis]CAG9123161.1 unnamed protein product [Bursaphelenchus okinawaensis]
MESDEYTPLLYTFSLPTLTDIAQNPEALSTDREPKTVRDNDLPCTSRSVHGAVAGGDRTKRRGASKRRSRARRVGSDNDVRRLRPFIASPFMPITTKPKNEPSDFLKRQKEPRSRSPTKYGTLLPKEEKRKELQTKQESENLVKTEPLDEAVAPLTGRKRADSESSDSSESETSESTDSSESYTKFSDLTRKQWATMGMLAVANLCSTVAFSCIAPFYPTEAKQKGMSSTKIGIIFGVFELVMFVTAPLLGKYMTAIGSKRMFTAGLFLTGVTAILFGFLNFLPSGGLFFWTSLVIRCLEALGDACFVTSSFAISAKCFPGRIATVVGLIETFAGLGYTAGPVIGAVLYQYGGFQMPFLVLGSLLILATVVSIFLVEDVEDEEAEDTKGMLGMLRMPVIWLMVFAVVICAISLSFFDPTLSNHLESFKLSTTMVGLMFLLCGGIYTLTAPLWGLIIDQWNCCYLLMFFGSCATVISMLFVGPSPIFGMEKNLVVIGLSLSLFGVAAGALYIPTFQNCLNAVKKHGYEDNFQTYGCVSGVFQAAFAFGAFLGPTLGGFGVEQIGFEWTTTIIAVINVVFIIFMCQFFAIRKLTGNDDDDENSTDADSETSKMKA